jgi:hypothetical protein
VSPRLELWRRQGPWVNCERSRVFQELDYLLDKFYASMLSGMEAEGQGQSARTDDAVPIWECVKATLRWKRVPGSSFPTFTRERKGGPATIRRLASCFACFRRSVVATSAKNPALSHRTREGRGTRFCVGEGRATEKTNGRDWQIYA